MNKIKIIILVSLTALLTSGFVGASTRPATTQWEYGVYRVGYSGPEKYTWRTEGDCLTARSQRFFLWKVAGTLDNVTKSEIEFDTLMLNYLGTQGWELVETHELGFGVVINRTFWMKRKVRRHCETRLLHTE